MDSKTVSLLGAIIVSFVALVTFTGALVVAFLAFFKSTDPIQIQLTGGLLNLTVGAAIANATTAVGFWLGSSSGSQKKDETIAALSASGGGAAPVVSAINPTIGPVAGGTRVTVTGTGFTGATSVKFGTKDASAVTVVSDTQITATSPPGTGAGAVDITVAAAAGTSAASLADQFTYQ